MKRHTTGFSNTAMQSFLLKIDGKMKNCGLASHILRPILQDSPITKKLFGLLYPQG
jgi:hypothetical protein